MLREQAGASALGFDGIMGPADDSRLAESKETLTADQALERIGTGRFQFFALHVCGLANMAEAVETLSISLLLPVVEDDLGLTAGGRAALTTSIFAGMMIGGAVWGLFGDCLGRRTPLIAALLLSSVFSAASSMATSIEGLTFLRTISGIGVGGTLPTAFTYMAEVVEPSKRGRFLVLLAAHWMVGSVVSAVLGWILIPTAGWRAFLLTMSLPAAAGAVETFFLPESPRFHLTQGNNAGALAGLGRISRWNRSPWAPDVLGTELRCDGPATAEGVGNGSGSREGGEEERWREEPRGAAARLLSKMRTQAQEIGQHLAGLVRPEHRRNSLALGAACLGLSAGWYGLLLWFPEFSKRRGAQPVQIYVEMLLVALASLPGNIGSYFLVDSLGRRKTLAVSMAAGAFFVAFFAFLPANGARSTTILGTASIMVFNGISVAGWNALDLLTPELYPTSLRCTAMGILGLISRIGSIAGNAQTAWLVEKAEWASLVVSSAFLAAGTMAVLSLPETAGKSLDEDPEGKTPATSEQNLGNADTIDREAVGPKNSSTSEEPGGSRRILCHEDCAAAEDEQMRLLQDDHNQLQGAMV